ncbi:VIT family protein [Corynebacterium incognita]|uniref:VIT family protein n=1 Tax=Corynebacterium incognita TaxID=2754725 RepID=A0A7G7CN57_9CORY|nr:VIT family protein [Corynebacterium incognita]QNE89023.1 VIT family protein [Corynebacterium incognita]
MSTTTTTRDTARDSAPESTNISARTNTLRAGVLGANDGIVSVAALLLGVVASGAGPGAILTAGIASTVAGAGSMALGEYVSVSSQRDTEKKFIADETRELADDPEGERRELAEILEGYGIAPDTAATAAKEISAGDPLRAHLQLELGVDSEELTNPWAAAGSSAIAFVLGAALPMLAVFLAPTSLAGSVIVAVTLLALALTGFTSAKLSDTSPGRAIVRLVLGGALGLAVTYGIGAAFGAAV